MFSQRGDQFDHPFGVSPITVALIVLSLIFTKFGKYKRYPSVVNTWGTNL